MNEITFLRNWNNKLTQPVFTTIRSYTKEKTIYYSNSFGKKFRIMLNDKQVSTAVLAGMKVMERRKIPYPMLCVDIGETNLDKINDIFNKFETSEKVIILVFKKI